MNIKSLLQQQLTKFFDKTFFYKFEAKILAFLKVFYELINKHTIFSKQLRENHSSSLRPIQTLNGHVSPKIVRDIQESFAISALILDSGIEKCKVKIISKRSKKTLLRTPGELCKDKSFIAKLNPVDANRIGYLAGLRDALRDLKLSKAANPIDVLY